MDPGRSIAAKRVLLVADGPPLVDNQALVIPRAIDAVRSLSNRELEACGTDRAH